jgi:ribosomal protein S18 acetylase RimI-like enzyme
MIEGQSPEATSLERGGAELLPRVEPLWSQLRTHHAELSPRWGDSLLGMSFEDRRQELLAKSSGGMLVALARRQGEDVGYCVSTIAADGTGEVDSLFVVESQRGQGIGRALISATMAWFTERCVSLVAVEIIVGNDAALRFYERRGFAARTVRLISVGARSGHPA